MNDEIYRPVSTGAGAAARRERESPPPVRLPASEKANLLVQLVSRMARSEQPALAELYDETSAMLNGLLLRILESPQDAEEALLDVYMKAWKNAASYSPDRGSVHSWLVIMARSIAIDRIRHKRALPRTSGIEPGATLDFISGEASPEQQTAALMRGRVVRNVLRELPPEQREVLELAYFAGLTHSELAIRLGQPLGTVKSRIRMALVRLRDLLGEGAAV